MIGYPVTGAAAVLLLAFLALALFGKGRLKAIADDGRAARATSVVLVLTFLIICAGSAVFQSELDSSHDIDDAITSAVVHFVHGGNPYRDEVVPRFTEVYHDGVEMTNGTLNYLPSTLVVYSGAYLLLGPIGPFWFELSNILFGALTAIVLARTFPTARKGILLPAVGSVTVFLMFDNIMLTVLLFSVGSYFLFRSGSKYRLFLALSFLFLAFYVKMAGMLSLAVVLLYLVQKDRFKDGRTNVQLAAFALLALSVLALSAAVFGLRDLVDSTFLFMSDPDARANGAYFGGTVLTEVAGGSPYFSLISYAVLIGTLAATLFIRDLLPRMFMAEAVLPFVAVKDSQSLLAIPALLLFFFAMVRSGRSEGPIT